MVQPALLAASISTMGAHMIQNGLHPRYRISPRDPQVVEVQRTAGGRWTVLATYRTAKIAAAEVTRLNLRPDTPLLDQEEA